MDLTPQTGNVKRFDEIYPDYDPSLDGIGGWLIVLIIGKFLTFFDLFSLPKLISYYGMAAEFDTYITLTIIATFLVEVVLSVLILIFIFSRNILFRTLLVVQYSLYFIFILASVLYFSRYNISSLWSQLVGTLIGAAIWIPYLFISRRVKNTYIYPKLYDSYTKTYGYVNSSPLFSAYGVGINTDTYQQTEIKPIANPSSDGSYNISDIKISGSESVSCPVCNTVQNSDRSCCFNCGAKFIQ